MAEANKQYEIENPWVWKTVLETKESSTPGLFGATHRVVVATVETVYVVNSTRYQDDLERWFAARPGKKFVARKRDWR